MPRARQDEICNPRAGRLVIKLQAPPVDGKANAALAALLSQDFAVHRAEIEIRGASSRDKTIAIRSPRRLPDWFQRLAAGA
jgi:hypothetical protein